MFGLACCLLAPFAVSRASASGVALQTGISEDPGGPEAAQALAHVAALGSRFQRLTFGWRTIAQRHPHEPANPNDPAYHWDSVDRLIAATIAHGLTPYIGIDEPPAWGQSPQGAGETSPDPNQLALFSKAFATRYNGAEPGRPWVRYWEVWNEPNASFFLQPQIQQGHIVSIESYRSILNASAEAIHQADPQDIVIGGALYPNGQRHGAVVTIAPLEFMRGLFCLSGGQRPHRVCNGTVDADIWSIHPYTTGGPSTLPANPDNVWIANLGSLTKLVRTAQRLGAITSTHPVQTWVTEFSWGSTPPAPKGVPLALEQRWVSEALYRAWSAGVSQFSWYALRDETTDPSNLNPFGGLYFECTRGIYCDRPKPAAAAFRFPFIARPSSWRRVLVWGRTPSGTLGYVQVQWRSGTRWRNLIRLKTDRDGVFTARTKLPRGASKSSAVLRAVLLAHRASSSPPFSLRHVPDIPVTPFGT